MREDDTQNFSDATTAVKRWTPKGWQANPPPHGEGYGFPFRSRGTRTARSERADPSCRKAAIGILAAVALLGWTVDLGPGALHAADLPVIYQQDFANAAALKGFVFTDPKAWRLAPATAGEPKAALELVKQSQYQPPVRSPVNMALIADRVFTDFTLDVEMKQTGREYGHRDMCLFFGIQSPTNFYYAHIATKADDHAHNVFIVNGAPRVKFAEKTTTGANWGLEAWHTVRLERKGSDGSVRVFFDDMANPIMVAKDVTFKSGYVGFGSFDDTGKIAAIRIRGPSVETREIRFFGRGQ